MAPGEADDDERLVLRERHGAVLELRLNNPPFNGLSGPLLVSYMQALEEARLDDGVRAVVTTANGPIVVCGRRPVPAEGGRTGKKPLGHAPRVDGETATSA